VQAARLQSRRGYLLRGPDGQSSLTRCCQAAAHPRPGGGSSAAAEPSSTSRRAVTPRRFFGAKLTRFEGSAKTTFRHLPPGHFVHTGLHLRSQLDSTTLNTLNARLDNSQRATAISSCKRAQARCWEALCTNCTSPTLLHKAAQHHLRQQRWPRHRRATQLYTPRTNRRPT
jgi:hypothetical protein